MALHPNQTELISGDQNGNVRVWDLQANGCMQEIVPGEHTPRDTTTHAPTHHRRTTTQLSNQPNRRLFTITSHRPPPTVRPPARPPAQPTNQPTTARYADGDVPIRSVAVASDASMVVAGNNSAKVFGRLRINTHPPPHHPATPPPRHPPPHHPTTPPPAWQPSSGEYTPKSLTETRHDGYLLKCVISPDVTRLVSG